MGSPLWADIAVGLLPRQSFHEVDAISYVLGSVTELGQNERGFCRFDHRYHGWCGDRAAAGSWNTPVHEVSAFSGANKE